MLTGSRPTAATGRWRRLAAHNPLPSGTTPVAAGLAISGLTAYGFLAITARALGPAAYAPVSVLWTLVFIAVPGLFLPLEQEVGRAVSARSVHGVGARSVVLRAGAAGGAVAVLVAVVVGAAAAPVIARLFDGEGSLLSGFVVAVLLYAGYYVVRGMLAGTGAFGAYGVLLSAEGLVRAVAVAVLAAAGVHAAGLYGLAVGLPVVAGVGAGLLLRRGGLEHGPPSTWTEISQAVGLLAAGSVLGQLLINAGPLAVKLLAGPEEQAAAGTFLNGLVMARIPLFFFQAVQASLLPSLAAQAAAGRLVEFRRGLLRLMLAVVFVGGFWVVGSAALGPYVVSHFFGAGYRLSHLDMALLAAGSGFYMVALGMVQGIIALSGHRVVPLGWLAGVAGFVVVAAAAGGVGVTLRVELGLVAGSLLALVVAASLLEVRLRAATQRAPRG